MVMLMRDIEDTYNCIVKLQDTGNYYDRWKQVRDIYKPQLDNDLFTESAQFTPHDYSRHCVNIYRIIDIILPDAFYSSDKFTTEQLFVLDVAILMHDIGMFYDPASRNNHNEVAKNYILESVLDSKNSFLSAILTEEEASFIASIIFGHSDIKDDKGGIVVDTISELPDSNFREGLQGPINTRMLAGILRIADEFDITSGRVTGNQLVRPRITNDSEEHWRKCEIFGLPSIPDDNKTKIYLRPNDHKINLGGDLDNDVVLMLSVENKINSELFKLNDLVFNSGCLEGWTYSATELYTDDRIIKQRILKQREYQNPLSSTSVNISEKNPSDNSINIEEPNLTQDVVVISESFSKKLEKWVVENSFLRSGHYYIDRNRYARDWIETHGLLSNFNYADELSDIFAKYLVSLNGNSPDIKIIGEGFPGIILASLLAFRNGYPLTYHIPNQHNGNHSDQEKAIDVKKDDKIVIVTDVIVTGKTISTTIESLKETHLITDDNILKIIAIFFRRPLGSPIDIPSQILDKVVCGNDTLPIEICRKEECLFNKFGLIDHQYKPTS